MIIEDREISVKKIKYLHDMIKKELDQGPDLLIDFKEVKRVDLAAVQLIIASGREARAAGKTIKLKGVSADVKRQLHIGGLKI